MTFQTCVQTWEQSGAFAAQLCSYCWSLQPQAELCTVEAGKQAMGKNCQLSAENFSGSISSQKITPVSTQACSSHSVILRSGVLRGSVVVVSVAGRGSAVVQAWTQLWEVAAGRVHRQHLLCPKCSRLPTTSTTLRQDNKDLELAFRILPV